MALSAQPEDGYGNLALWPGSHVPLHEALAKSWGKQAHRAPRTAHRARGPGWGRGVWEDKKPALPTATL